MPSPKPKQSLACAFGCAFKGLKLALSERQFKIHCLVTILIVATGFKVGLSTAHWLWIISAITLVLITEMINTSIEHTIDLITQDHHPLAEKAKDIAAGAVILASMYATIIGVIIFSAYIHI